MQRHSSGPASLATLISKPFRKSFEDSRDPRFPRRPGLIMDLPEDEQPRKDGLDPMPSRPEILYPRLNYHIAELKRLQAIVIDLNKAKKGADRQLDDIDAHKDVSDGSLPSPSLDYSSTCVPFDPTYTTNKAQPQGFTWTIRST